MTAVVNAAVLVVASLALAGSVTGSTPRTTADAAMKQYVTNQVHNYKNFPGMTYQLGGCKRLFVKPWLAWRCAYQLHYDAGSPIHCYTLTIAIKRIPGEMYRGTVRRAGCCSPSC